MKTDGRCAINDYFEENYMGYVIRYIKRKGNLDFKKINLIKRFSRFRFSVIIIKDGENVGSRYCDTKSESTKWAHYYIKGLNKWIK